VQEGMWAGVVGIFARPVGTSKKSRINGARASGLAAKNIGGRITRARAFAHRSIRDRRYLNGYVVLGSHFRHRGGNGDGGCVTM